MTDEFGDVCVVTQPTTGTLSTHAADLLRIIGAINGVSLMTTSLASREGIDASVEVVRVRFSRSGCKWDVVDRLGVFATGRRPGISSTLEPGKYIEEQFNKYFLITTHRCHTCTS